jgi:hypothetical protein
VPASFVSFDAQYVSVISNVDACEQVKSGDLIAQVEDLIVWSLDVNILDKMNGVILAKVYSRLRGTRPGEIQRYQ